MEHKKYSEEQISKAANISIYEYAKAHGYDCEKTGREIHIKGYGGLFINVEENKFFNHSENYGGQGCISFVRYMEGLSFTQAMEALVGEGAISYEKKEWKSETKVKPTEFTPPEKASNYKNLYAYLMKERMLDKDIITDFVKKGILYQTTSEYTANEKNYKNENIVFLHKTEDGTVCGASEQGTKSDKRFKKNYEGTDKDLGFMYKKGYVPDKIVYLFEAPIDLMSFVQLHPEIENAHFVAMEGLKPSIAKHYINEDWLVYSCVDNDAAGKAFNDKILNKKMAESFGGKCTSMTVSDREPPIEYLEAEHNGKKINLFLSDEDYNSFKSIQKCESAACFVWKNNSRFSVITECKENGVKDFNDLLKLKRKVPLSLEERLNIAWNPHSTPDELAKLINDENVGVRVRVAKNRNLPISALNILAKDEFIKVRIAAQETLDFLSRNIRKSSSDRESKDEQYDKADGSFMKKIENIERTADKIENAIASGQMGIDISSEIDSCSER